MKLFEGGTYRCVTKHRIPPLSTNVLQPSHGRVTKSFVYLQREIVKTNQMQHDPTTDGSETVRGPICDLVEEKIMLASAEEYRSHCDDVHASGAKAMQVISDGKITADGRWVQES